MTTSGERPSRCSPITRSTMIHHTDGGSSAIPLGILLQDQAFWRRTAHNPTDLNVLAVVHVGRRGETIFEPCEE